MMLPQLNPSTSESTFSRLTGPGRSLAARAAIVLALAMPARADIAQITLSPTDQALGGHVFPDFDDASADAQ